jgi:hypothetical protein
MIFFTPTQINMLGFKINTMDNASIVNSGSLQYIDQFLSYKRNQALGETSGDLSPINIPISSVTDPDVIDDPTTKTSLV